MDIGTRDRLLGRLAEAIESVTTAHPVRAAVDGPPGAGMTTLADALALVLHNGDREVIRSSIESFLMLRPSSPTSSCTTTSPSGPPSSPTTLISGTRS
jgi:uridine kinase